MRAIVFSAVSGCVWGLIAWYLLELRINAVTVIAVLASPLIGMIMGIFSKGFRDRSTFIRVAIALVTLYFAVALFGAVVGVGDLFFGLRTVRAKTVGLILETVWFFVAGLTAGWFFVVLWPLSYFNHLVISRIWAGTKRVSSA